MSELKNEAFQTLARTLAPDGQLRRAWPLTGGVSAQVTGLEIQQLDGRIQKFVVRQHGQADLRHNPHIAADEFRLLQRLRQAGLPVPAAYAYDESGQILGSPYVVIEFVDGAMALDPSNLSDGIDQLAAHLAQIHRVDWQALDLFFLPARDERLANAAVGTLDARATDLQASIHGQLDPLWPLPRRNGMTLLHGDYWPGNVLWKERHLVAILDWEDAHVGDPLADLANARLELLWAFSPAAMQQFTQQYQNASGADLSALPAWDLWAALRPMGKMSGWGLDKDTAQRMGAQLHWFAEQALARHLSK